VTHTLTIGPRDLVYETISPLTHIASLSQAWPKLSTNTSFFLVDLTRPFSSYPEVAVIEAAECLILYKNFRR